MQSQRTIWSGCWGGAASAVRNSIQPPMTQGGLCLGRIDRIIVATKPGSGGLVETIVKLDRLPSAQSSRVIEISEVFVFDDLIPRDEVSCERFAH